jgi:1-acyl-sn-glycerol-3-phosphate acyltransferase
VLAQARIVLATAKISLATVAESLTGKIERGTIDRRLKGWGQELLDIVEMTVDVRGRDAVDWSRAYVVMSNHQSLLDIPVIAVAVPGSLRFVAKKELFRVPLWGPAMRAAGIISIDRQNRESAIASLRDAGAALKSGVNIWIAPEGTRSLDGELLPLKKGGFVLAAETGADILPVVIDGTRHARKKHERGLVKGVRATVAFGTPIPTAGRDRDELMRAVEAVLRAGRT